MKQFGMHGNLLEPIVGKCSIETSNFCRFSKTKSLQSNKKQDSLMTRHRFFALYYRQYQHKWKQSRLNCPIKGT